MVDGDVNTHANKRFKELLIMECSSGQYMIDA
jgi:hypothetical protein